MGIKEKQKLCLKMHLCISREHNVTLGSPLLCLFNQAFELEKLESLVYDGSDLGLGSFSPVEGVLRVGVMRFL